MAEFRIYTRFCEGGGFAGEIIEAFSREWVSHCEFWQPEWPAINKTFGAQVKGGVIWRSVDDPCYADVKRTEIWSAPVTDEQMTRLQEIFKQVEGEKYNEEGIAAFALGHILPVKDRFFCSQFVMWALNKIGLLPLAFDPTSYTPGNALQALMQLPGAQLFW